MGRNGQSTESVLYQSLSLLIEPRMQVVCHAEAEETVGIFRANLLEIVVLQSVDELLNHHGGLHLCIVHVRQEHLGGVSTVDHKWWNHLHFLIKEDAATVLKRAYHLAVPRCVLLKPQMTVGIDYQVLHIMGTVNQLFFHLTNIWSPMIRCTSFTSCSSIGSFTYPMFFSTLSGLALLKSVVAMRGLRLVENCMASFSMG